MAKLRANVSRCGVIAVLLVSLFGCSSVPKTKQPDMTAQQKLEQLLLSLPAVEKIEEWPLPEVVHDAGGSRLKIFTRHYEICTTLTDPLILRQLPVFLESAFRSYGQVVELPVEAERKLLKVYFFETRQQWEDYTNYWAGRMAPSYLKIKSGAYYLNGASVAYKLSRQSNFSVLAHEGWHQYVDEFFEYRMPAWLNEGLATYFEAYDWQQGQVSFSAALNNSRLWDLKETMAKGRMFSVADLLVLDAGKVLSHSHYRPADEKGDPQVAAYYAQIYALVRFLREYNYRQYELDFRKMVGDGYKGDWPLEAGQENQAQNRKLPFTTQWNGAVGQLIFRYYIKTDISVIEQQYQQFCLEILSRVRFGPKGMDKL